MKKNPAIPLAAFLIASLLMLTSCDPKNEGEPNSAKEAAQQMPSIPGKEESDNQSNWVITVRDSATMNFGPVKVVKKITMRAVNASGEIEGDYTGTFTSQDTQNVNESEATVDGTSTTIGENLKFTLIPYLNPLVQPDGDLNPLVKPGEGPDYQGQGTMDWVTEGSGTAKAGGKSVNDNYGRRDTVTFKMVVTGSLAKLILSSPQGDLYFNGTLQQGGSEDDFVPEPLVSPKKDKDGEDFKPEPLKVPEEDAGDFVPEPLVPPTDDTFVPEPLVVPNE